MIVRLVQERCAITFQSNWIYNFHLADSKMGEKIQKMYIEERPEPYADIKITLCCFLRISAILIQCVVLKACLLLS